MRLDIDSPAGRVTLLHERDIMTAIEAARPGVRCIETDKAKPADVDGVMLRGDQLIAVYESKCRNNSWADMRDAFRGEWMVTFDKLQRGAALSKGLRVPYVGLLYLIEEPMLLVATITNDDGQFLPAIRLRRTRTQRTVNGGSIVRTNAFINLSHATEIPISPSGERRA